MNGTKVKTAVLDKPRARRDAAKVLAIALQTRYRIFLESSGDADATVVATADLAQCMYENIEFIMWALKTVGGLNPAPPETLSKISGSAAQAMALTTPPPVANDTVLDMPCNCPPLEHGIIGRERHMTSCPKFKP